MDKPKLPSEVGLRRTALFDLERGTYPLSEAAYILKGLQEPLAGELLKAIRSLDDIVRQIREEATSAEVILLPGTGERAPAPRTSASERPVVESREESTGSSRLARCQTGSHRPRNPSLQPDRLPKTTGVRTALEEAPCLSFPGRSVRVHRASYILPPIALGVVALMGVVAVNALRRRGQFSPFSRQEGQADE